MTRKVIAIDGPAGSGKSTLARRLAAALDLPLLDTGLLYRAVAQRLLAAGDRDIDAAMALRAAHSLSSADVEMPGLHAEAVGQMASKVAVLEEVRAALLPFQRRFAAQASGAVLVGRDVGTVVCPDASHKIFVNASVEERARRRFEELRRDDNTIMYDRVLAEMRQRDVRDRTRKIAPLVAASDAHTLDTTWLDADAAFRAACRLVEGVTVTANDVVSTSSQSGA